MAHDLGDTVPLGVDVADEDGGATTPGSITLTIDLPDGTTATPTLSNPSAGRYEHDYVATQAGRHGWRVVSTSPATAFADTFDVRSAAPRYLISLADAKRHLNMTGTDNDEELRGYIEAATEVIERHLGTTVVRAQVVEVHRLQSPRRRIALHRWPVQSLTSIVSEDGVTTWDVDDFDVDRNTGVISGTALSGDVVVTYVAGPSVVSPSYALAAQIIVGHLFETQRTAAAGPQTGFGGEEILTPDGTGYALPHRAMELLGAPMPMVG